MQDAGVSCQKTALDAYGRGGSRGELLRTCFDNAIQQL